MPVQPTTTLMRSPDGKSVEMMNRQKMEVGLRCVQETKRRGCINVTFFRSSANKEICDLKAIRRAVIFYLNFVINIPRTMTA